MSRIPARIRRYETSSMNRNPILCAIDTPDPGRARALTAAVSNAVGGIKLGLEFFVANGPAALRQMAGATPLFLDLKLHDIPNTVAGAGRPPAAPEPPLLPPPRPRGAPRMRAAPAAASGAGAGPPSQKPAGAP